MQDKIVKIIAKQLNKKVEDMLKDNTLGLIIK